MTSLTKRAAFRIPRLKNTVAWLVPVLLGALVAMLATAHIGGQRTVDLPLAEGPAPWPPPDRTAERARTIGLPSVKPDGTTPHPHAHLDIFVDGVRMPVPEGLGLAPTVALHTHSSSGILHMETDDEGFNFTMGQLFKLWGIRINESCIGQYCRPGTNVQIYLSGRDWGGPIAAAPLMAGSEIAVVIGAPPPEIPTAYQCEGAPDVEQLACQSFG